MSKWTPSRYVEYGEREEQYEWTQTPEDVTVTVKIPPKTRTKDVEVALRPTSLRVAVRGGEVFVDGALSRSINAEESTWTRSEEGVVEVLLAKGSESRGDDEAQWWPSVIKGHKEADVKAMASTRFLDESLLKRIWEEKHNPKPASAEPSSN